MFNNNCLFSKFKSKQSEMPSHSTDIEEGIYIYTRTQVHQSVVIVAR